MRHLVIGAIACLLLAGCGESMAGDAGAEGGGDCVGMADGTACGAGNICLSDVCRESRCGDGYVNRAAGEDCEDGNSSAFDGCEPDDCTYTCDTTTECVDSNICNGEESCSELRHVCVPAPELLEEGMACTLGSGGGGVCHAGDCVEMGCGNGVIEEDEHCDDGNAVALDGCENDCRWSCEIDPSIPNMWYLDCDGDGFSVSNPTPREQCLPPPPPDPCGGSWTLGPPDGVDDCDDGDESVYPGALETCNDRDDDCDGMNDVGAVHPSGSTACYDDAPATIARTSPCQNGTFLCRAGSWTCDGDLTAMTEICDGVDNDCDGTLDDGFMCRSGSAPVTYDACGTPCSQPCDTTTCTRCECTLSLPTWRWSGGSDAMVAPAGPASCAGVRNVLGTDWWFWQGGGGAPPGGCVAIAGPSGFSPYFSLPGGEYDIDVTFVGHGHASVRMNDVFSGAVASAEGYPNDDGFSHIVTALNTQGHARCSAYQVVVVVHDVVPGKALAIAAVEIRRRARGSVPADRMIREDDASLCH